MRRALVALSLGVAVGQPTIRVPVQLVSLPAIVFSKDNRLLLNLAATDFRVFDNGRLQAARLDTESTPVSVVLAIQTNRAVRDYLPFLAKEGSAVDAMLVGESGEAAVVTYDNEVSVVKPFGTGDLQSGLKKISGGSEQTRMIDAGVRAVELLADRPRPRNRVLLFVGQAMDSGSQQTLEFLRERAEKENVAIYALVLPQLGKSFVSDTFSLQGVPKETSLQGVSKATRGGYISSVDLGKLVAVMNRSARAQASADPFSILTAATGGTQLHFRKQRQLENAIAAIGVELRSGYMLSYYPNSQEPGYHNVKIEVNVPGAKAYARPGYWFTAN